MKPILTFFLSFGVLFAFGQPESFTISGHMLTDANGSWKTADVTAMCPCYDEDVPIPTKSISTFPMNWVYRNARCSDIAGLLGNVTSNVVTCDITNATLLSGTLTNVVYPENPIPTLSQWGLMLLGLLMLILGVVAVKQRVEVVI